MAFSSNLFGSITHRGGRDAHVPVRAASRQLSATPTGSPTRTGISIVQN
ncbi:MAG: hypothetical protein LBQ66_05740 [Planctomycetaceae bacterium]|nr:hypothetical protein [Planctomycetaceae bacterium]